MNNRPAVQRQSQPRPRWHHDELREALAERTGTDAHNWFPVFKARYGMQVVFRSIASLHGTGAVLTQLFTCCTAVDPIICSGFTPRYADVSEETMSIDASGFETAQAPNPNLRAVMLQHTFGLIDEQSSVRLSGAAAAAGALLVEDCAHCATRMARGLDGQPLADISLHSFGVEKILPTRFGGAVWVNPRLAETDPRLHAELCQNLDALPDPPRRIDIVTKLYINQNRVFRRLPRALAGRARQVMANIGWYEPPITQAERRGRLQYKPMAMTPWMAHRAAEAIRALDANELARIRVVDLYRAELRDVAGLRIPSCIDEGESQPLLRFPLFACDTETAERIIAAILAAGGYAERWYRPELFPGVSDEAAYGLDSLDRASVPVTQRLVAGAVSLPTEVSLDKAKLIAAAIRQTIA